MDYKPGVTADRNETAAAPNGDAVIARTGLFDKIYLYSDGAINDIRIYEIVTENPVAALISNLNTEVSSNAVVTNTVLSNVTNTVLSNVTATVGLKASELNIDGNKNIGVNINNGLSAALTIQGTQSAGATFTGNPVVIGIVNTAGQTSKWPTDSTGTPTIGLQYIRGNPVVQGGISGSLGIGGVQSASQTATANPVLHGGKVITALDAAATTAHLQPVTMDSAKRIITVPYCNPEQSEQYTSGNVLITAATTTQIFAAAGAGIRHYITSMSYHNTNAQASGFYILDGATIIFAGTAIANQVDATILTFPVPLKGTANTALSLQTLVDGISFKINVQGFKSY